MTPVVKELENVTEDTVEDEVGTDMGVFVPTASVLSGGEASSSDTITVAMDLFREEHSMDKQESHFQSLGCLRDLLLLSSVHFLWWMLEHSLQL